MSRRTAITIGRHVGGDRYPYVASVDEAPAVLMTARALGTFLRLTGVQNLEEAVKVALESTGEFHMELLLAEEQITAMRAVMRAM